MQCLYCGFEVELDDVKRPARFGRVQCVYCWERDTGNWNPVSLQLRRDIYDALAGVMPDETRNYRPHPFGYQS